MKKFNEKEFNFHKNEMVAMIRELVEQKLDENTRANMCSGIMGDFLDYLKENLAKE